MMLLLTKIVMILLITRIYMKVMSIIDKLLVTLQKVL